MSHDKNDVLLKSLLPQSLRDMVYIKISQSIFVFMHLQSNVTCYLHLPLVDLHRMITPPQEEHTPDVSRTDQTTKYGFAIFCIIYFATSFFTLNFFIEIS